MEINFFSGLFFLALIIIVFLKPNKSPNDYSSGGEGGLDFEDASEENLWF